MSAPRSQPGFKAIALLKRRADLSHEAFIAYYETHHAPLIVSLAPGLLAYRRNFVDFAGAFLAPDAAVDFDVVTELWYADRAAYETALAVQMAPANAARIAADEENFLDRAHTRMFVVDVFESALGAA